MDLQSSNINESFLFLLTRRTFVWQLSGMCTCLMVIVRFFVVVRFFALVAVVRKERFVWFHMIRELQAITEKFPADFTFQLSFCMSYYVTFDSCFVRESFWTQITKKAILKFWFCFCNSYSISMSWFWSSFKFGWLLGLKFSNFQIRLFLFYVKTFNRDNQWLFPEK